MPNSPPAAPSSAGTGEKDTSVEAPPSATTQVTSTPATSDVGVVGSSQNNNNSGDAAAVLTGGESKATDKKEDPTPKREVWNIHKRLLAATTELYLPEKQKATVEQLRVLQDRHIELEEEYRKEWNALKLKFLTKFKPLYQDRCVVLAGGSDSPRPEAPPTAATGAEGGDAAVVPVPPPVGGTKNLPGFWFKAMSNHSVLSEMIESHDEDILHNLIDIQFEWVDPKEQTSFKIDFHFCPNDYFENDILSKIYHLEVSEVEDDENVLTKTEGTVIKWKEGKNVTQRVVTRKQRNKKTHQTRTITETLDANSFFNFFQSHEIPSAEELEEMEETDVTELEMIVEAEFEIGCVLRDKIIPRALGWYLGVEKDDEEDESEESDEFNEDSDDEE